MTRWIFKQFIKFYTALAVWRAGLRIFLRHASILREPISATTALIISLSISAAMSAGSYLITRALAPKPKGQIINNLAGQATQFTDSSWGGPIFEVYGARPASNEAGGVQLGGNVIWAPVQPITVTSVTTPGSTGGGKGAPKPPPNTTNTYRLTCAVSLGRAGQRVLQIKANEDILFSAINFAGTAGGGIIDYGSADYYEAEAATLSGASSTADTQCSGGNKVTGIGNGNTVTFDVTGAGYRQVIELIYKTASDRQAYVRVGGAGTNLYTFATAETIDELRTAILAAAANFTVNTKVGSVVKSSANAWDSGIRTVPIAAGVDSEFEIVVQAGTLTLGYTADSTPTTNTDIICGLQFNNTGVLSYWNGTTSVAIGNWSPGDRFAASKTTVFGFTQNGSSLDDLFTAAAVPNGTLYGAIAAFHLGATVSESNFSPALPYKRITRFLESGSNTIEVYNATADCPDLDRIIVHPGVVFDPIDPSGGGIHIDPSGGIDPIYPVNRAQDPFTLEDPKEEDDSSFQRYNYRVETNDGVTVIPLANGGTATVYDGRETQDPDPLIVADIDTQYGAGSTPAYRGLSMVVFEDVDITKYGSLPNFSFVTESTLHRTVGEMMQARAVRAGLDLTDLDFKTAKAVKLRGYLVSQIQAPATDFADLGRTFNLGLRDSNEATLQTFNLDDRTTVHSQITSIPATDQGAYIFEGDQNESADLVVTTIPERTKPWHVCKIGYVNPLKQYQTDAESDTNEFAVGNSVEEFNTQAVLLPDEALGIAKRELQSNAMEQAPHQFAVSSVKYGALQAGDRVPVEIDGALRTVRVREIQGALPGVYQISAVDDNHTVLTNSGDRTADETTLVKRLPYPANSVCTLIDIPRLLDSEQSSGIYAAACSRDLSYGTWTGAALYVDQGEDYRLKATFKTPCTMGRADDVLDDGAYSETGAWDITATVTVDLFNGTLESLAGTKVLDGANLFVIGNEVVAAQSCVRDSGYPNRWVLSNLQRGLKGTSAVDHVQYERVVFLNSAVQYVELEASEAGIERSYKCVTSGQRLADASEMLFTWEATSIAPILPQGVLSRVEFQTNTLADTVLYTCPLGYEAVITSHQFITHDSILSLAEISITHGAASVLSTDPILQTMSGDRTTFNLPIGVDLAAAGSMLKAGEQAILTLDATYLNVRVEVYTLGFLRPDPTTIGYMTDEAGLILYDEAGNPFEVE